MLLHGTAGGAFGWDFPVRPEKYSVTRALARAGYPTVAIDELGYASSDHPNGYTLTITSYADIAHQIVRQLREGTYTAPAPAPFGRVGLVGHSGGGEMAELSAGTYGGIDLLVVMGFIHTVSDEVARVFTTEEIPRALGDDYVFFWGTKERVHHFHHNPAYIDADVLAKVDELTTLTPSGLILTIGPFPSRAVMGSISVPLLLMVSEKDTIFPVDRADEEMDLFVSAADKTLHVVPKAGHHVPPRTQRARHHGRAGQLAWRPSGGAAHLLGTYAYAGKKGVSHNLAQSRGRASGRRSVPAGRCRPEAGVSHPYSAAAALGGPLRNPAPVPAGTRRNYQYSSN